MREGVALRSAVSVGRGRPRPVFFHEYRESRVRRAQALPSLPRGVSWSFARGSVLLCAKPRRMPGAPGPSCFRDGPAAFSGSGQDSGRSLPGNGAYCAGESSGSKVRQHRRRSLPPCTGASLRTASCAGSAMLRPLRAGRPLARASACPGEDLSHVVRGVFVFGARRSPKKSPQRSGLRVRRPPGGELASAGRTTGKKKLRHLATDTGTRKQDPALGNIRPEGGAQPPRGKGTEERGTSFFAGEAGRARFASEGPGRVLWGRVLCPWTGKFFRGVFFRNRPAGSWGRRIFSWPGCICRS